MLRVWVHVHSTHSYDGQCSLDEIAQAARDACVDVVLLSEHSDHFSAEAYAGLSRACGDHNASGRPPLLAPGIEVTAASGRHVLCFGLEHWIEPLRGESEIIADAHSQASFVVLAHPSDRDVQDAAEQRLAFDSIEIWNLKRDRHRGRWDLARQIEERRRDGLAWHAIVGLDAHDLPDFQPAFIEVAAGLRSIDAVLDALRSGHYLSRVRGVTVGSDGGHHVAHATRVRSAVLSSVRRVLKLIGYPMRALTPRLFGRVKRRLSRYL